MDATRDNGSADAVKDTARTIANQQKTAGAQRIDNVAGAVHSAARDLEEQMPLAASFIHEAARQLETTASTLRERGVDEMMGSLGDFARRRPLAVFGGAVLAGLAMSRFLKSSNSAPHS